MLMVKLQGPLKQVWNCTYTSIRIFHAANFFLLKGRKFPLVFKKIED